MSTIQSRLESLMNNFFMNTSDVARKIGVSHTTIARLLGGSVPTSDTLYKLSILFDVSMEYILIGVDAHGPKEECSQPNILYNDKNAELIKYFSALKTYDQEEIIEIIKLKLKKEKEKKEDLLDLNNNSEIA